MKFILLFILVTNCIAAQIKGNVRDSISGQPISFVNIAVQNEAVGVSSEDNGDFIIPIQEKSKKLIFTAIGYQKKK